MRAFVGCFFLESQGLLHNTKRSTFSSQLVCLQLQKLRQQFLLPLFWQVSIHIREFNSIFPLPPNFHHSYLPLFHFLLFACSFIPCWKIPPHPQLVAPLFAPRFYSFLLYLLLTLSSDAPFSILLSPKCATIFLSPHSKQDLNRDQWTLHKDC